MPKIRRGGYVFFAYKSDHGPRHVHVYRNGRFLLKWDPEGGKAMTGRPTRKIIETICRLEKEGLI